MTERPLENPRKLPTPVLLLEPDQWRFRGMQSVLENGADIRVIGEPDYARILTIENASDDREPRVAIVAQRLLADFGISVIPHVKDLYPGCAVLIHGEHESNEATASILAAGGSGFYSLIAPPHYLARAVETVSEGKLWGPREAVALMASHAMQQQQILVGREDLQQDDLALLHMLNEGLGNKEIAARLQVAEVTVKTRLGRLYKRFGVNTRLQLLATAMKHGLIKVDSH